MDKKLGVYLCRGCGIGECLDTTKLVGIAANEYQISVVSRSLAFCLEVVQLLMADIYNTGR